MTTYYLKLALLALKRTPALSSLMVLAIALGLATAMTAFTVLYRMSNNPIPQKSDVLYAVQLDAWSPERPFDRTDNLPPDQLTHGDSRRLMALDDGYRKTGMWRSSVVVVPENTKVRPRNAPTRIVAPDFFAMFDAPFLHGQAWTAEQEARAERVVVISRELAERVFNKSDVVGDRIYLDDEQFQIVGVLDTWKLIPLFYDVTNNVLNETEDVFLPFSVGTGKEKAFHGSVNCWQPPGEGFKGLIDSECIMTQFWVELPDRGARERYQALLDAYVAEQRKAGRFKRPDNQRVVAVMPWLEQNEVIPRDTRMFVGIGAAFLLVCLLNATGLLLAKFLRKSGEIGLRRALGASKREVFNQHLVESGLIGACGAIAGLILTWSGLLAIRALIPEYQEIAQLDIWLFAGLFATALIGAVAAGAYPAWRACQVMPASQLKAH